MWMSGYAARTKPAEGTLHDLWAKAITLQDQTGNKVVLLTVDLIGVDRELGQKVRHEIAKKLNTPTSHVVLNCSHTHTGPVVGRNLGSMYDLDPLQLSYVREYTSDVEKELVKLALQSAAKLVPVKLYYGTTSATFGVNRRANSEKQYLERRKSNSVVGPCDASVSILNVVTDDQQSKVVLFGYACHATTLSNNLWSGDWPGFAQIELERAIPTAQAMFVNGCGADQNPMPRGNVNLAEEHGTSIAKSISNALPKNETITGPVRASEKEVVLAFAQPKSKDELNELTKHQNKYEQLRARWLQADWSRSGKQIVDYPYPVQVVRIGSVGMVFLGGEVVVDYALRLKRECQSTKRTELQHPWVSGYTNDVMAYIPSERVLAEGGYEGGGAMLYYGLPVPGKPVSSRRSSMQSTSNWIHFSHPRNEHQPQE